jgi:hypothetical protein
MNRSLVPPTIVMFLVAGCRPSSNTNIGDPVPHGITRTEDKPGERNDDSDTMSAPLPPAGPCAAERTKEACWECCGERETFAGERYVAAFARCACDSPGACAKECSSTYCVGLERTRNCRECLAQTKACDVIARTACTNDTGCKPLLECIDASDCAGASR